jgi:hypothetical protein
MEAAGFSEMFVVLYWTTQQHVSKDSNVYSHCHENQDIVLIWAEI